MEEGKDALERLALPAVSAYPSTDHPSGLLPKTMTCHNSPPATTMPWLAKRPSVPSPAPPLHPRCIVRKSLAHRGKASAGFQIHPSSSPIESLAASFSGVLRRPLAPALLPPQQCLADGVSLSATRPFGTTSPAVQLFHNFYSSREKAPN